MAETNDDSSKTKTLSLNRPGRLELKTTVDAGQVRQSFPHGRGKQVAVEVKKKRVIRPGRTEEAPVEAPAEQAKAAPEVAPEAPKPAPAPAPEAPAPEAAQPEAAAKVRPKSKEETRHAQSREAAARIDRPREVRAPMHVCAWGASLGSAHGDARCTPHATNSCALRTHTRTH